MPRDDSELGTYGPTAESRDNWITNSFHIVAEPNAVLIVKFSCFVRPVERISCAIVVAASTVKTIEYLASEQIKIICHTPHRRHTSGHTSLGWMHSSTAGVRQPQGRRSLWDMGDMSPQYFRFILSSNSNNCCWLYINANIMCSFSFWGTLSNRPSTRVPSLYPAGGLPPDPQSVLCPPIILWDWRPWAACTSPLHCKHI